MKNYYLNVNSIEEKIVAKCIVGKNEKENRITKRIIDKSENWKKYLS